ncbi:ParB/RepB/Spo0J family partition protein [Kineosporia babensis]|uniref:ParB/RepB/Spo0J family partition protein n=1 Tax=Kineosporia babensis TaxID=499548 RepID=A0A9X1SXP3_9ACTN|nr:ParB/RepB/Spo0J family partition protein [Kineosporia babensis]MCD5316151.1 ParB/RepB/Spo0J family partition protein [Kineosporia babensis]
MRIFADISPRQLIPNDRNRVITETAVEEMMASIRALGILQTLLVVPADATTENTADEDAEPEKKWRVIAGHTRREAALRLELATVPCLIAENSDEATELLRILGENLNRKGLTVLEEADYYSQLALLDVTPEQIQSTLALPAERVRSRLALNDLPATARPKAAQAVEAGTLDLTQIAALNSFADDEKAMSRILKKDHNTWGFAHALAEETRKRDRREMVAQFKAQLTLAGVKIVNTPKNWPYTSREAEASTLLDTDGNALDPNEVKAKPGFAAFINTDYTPRIVVICLDPEASGYTRTQYTRFVPDAEREAKEAAERERVAYQEALVDAAQVRRRFLHEKYATARASKKLFPEALRFVAGRPEKARISNTHFSDLALTLAGIPATVANLDEAATGAGMDRLQRIVVARWLTTSEANLDSIIAQRWDVDEPAGVAYLERLTAAGYELSEAEQRLHTEITQTIADDAAEDQDDEDTNDDEDDEDDEPAEDDDSETDTTANADDEAVALETHDGDQLDENGPEVTGSEFVSPIVDDIDALAAQFESVEADEVTDELVGASNH